MNKKYSVLLLLFVASFLVFGCASRGLIDRSYRDQSSMINRVEIEEPFDHNPTFFVYGDTQSGRLVIEKFYRRENWVTWKQVIFPFYQLYTLGAGILGGFNYLRHVPDYGEETRIMMRDVLYRDWQYGDYDFVLNVGDICLEDGSRRMHWETFLDEYLVSHPFLEEIPYLTTLGNHEYGNDTQYGFPNYESIFGYPRFYVVDFPDASLFVLDSNYLIDQWNLIPAELQEEYFRQWFASSDPNNPSWLEEQLQLRQDVPLKLVSMHHAPVTFGWHSRDWYQESYGSDLLEKRIEFLNVLASNGIQLVFSGHEHYYQHNVLETSLFEDAIVDSIHFVVSSGGGVPIRRAPDRDRVEQYLSEYENQGLNIQMMRQHDEHHYCKVSVSSEGIEIITYSVDRQYPHELEIVEEFSILSH